MLYHLKINNLLIGSLATALVLIAGWGPAAAVTLVFSAIGRAVRGVTTSGALAGAVVCLALILGAGWGGFAGLCTVFVVTWAATRVGYARKQKLGTAEARSGRNALQVLANIGVAAACALLHSATRDGGFLLGAGAALCEAAADTVSSEIGQAVGGSPRLITTWALAPTGTDGGITLFGSLAGVVSAVVVAISMAGFEPLPPHGAFISVGSGVLGMLFDSLLGATLERRRALGNNGVNFCSTLFAAGMAFLIGSLLSA